MCTGILVLIDEMLKDDLPLTLNKNVRLQEYHYEES